MTLKLGQEKHGDSPPCYIKARISLFVPDPGGSDLGSLANLLCKSRDVSQSQGHVAPPCLQSGDHRRRTIFFMTLACLFLSLLISAASNSVCPLHPPLLSDQTSDDVSLFSEITSMKFK